MAEKSYFDFILWVSWMLLLYMMLAGSWCSLAVLLFLMYLEKFLCCKIFFGLLYYGFIFNSPEYMLFVFWTEAENNSIPQVSAQTTFTKGSGICSGYLKMQSWGTSMHGEGRGVWWGLEGGKMTWQNVAQGLYLFTFPSAFILSPRIPRGLSFKYILKRNSDSSQTAQQL